LSGTLQAMEKVVTDGEQEREEYREDADREFEKLKREALVRLFRQPGLSELRIEFLCDLWSFRTHSVALAG
jgi:hypothetical protein